MQRVRSQDGTTVSFRTSGVGPPLVLVHGSFSDHNTNWEFVRPLLEERFSMYAVARRGRGETAVTTEHSVEDEAGDVMAVMAWINEPVFLLGHSYGAQVALAAAAGMPEQVRRLVLYEPPLPHVHTDTDLARLNDFAGTRDWDSFAATFFGDVLTVPAEEIDAMRGTPDWDSIVEDAEASLGDIRAFSRYRFDAARFRDLPMPVLLQAGTASPRDLFATDALAAVLPDARNEELDGQAHEAMTTAPALYAESVTRFLGGASD